MHLTVKTVNELLELAMFMMIILLAPAANLAVAISIVIRPAAPRPFKGFNEGEQFGK
jgi:hypothetical protein